MPTIRLPAPNRELRPYDLPPAKTYMTAKPGEALPRKALAAAHVVVDPWADNAPWTGVALDMDATLRFRHHLWDLGLGVAEAMDTAQRGMGLDWPNALALARATLAEARTRKDSVVYVGAGTDHIDPATATLERVVRAYLEQITAIQGVGGRVIVMASRALARVARGPGDYAQVYRSILAEAQQPVILHWLGPMFDPQLDGYWGSADLMTAMDRCLAVIASEARKVEGIKISLLDKNLEIAMRLRLPASVRMFTGDDFNYPELIAGDGHQTSDALLGIFDPIAPIASAALKALGSGDRAGYHATLDPTLALSREIFQAPTWHYKTGVVMLAYLAGHQDHFAMLGGQQSARSMLHLGRVFRLAAELGLFPDPDLAARRMRNILAPLGVEA